MLLSIGVYKNNKTLKYDVALTDMLEHNELINNTPKYNSFNNDKYITIAEFKTIKEAMFHKKSIVTHMLRSKYFTLKDSTEQLTNFSPNVKIFNKVLENMGV